MVNPALIWNNVVFFNDGFKLKICTPVVIIVCVDSRVCMYVFVWRFCDVWLFAAGLKNVVSFFLLYTIYFNAFKKYYLCFHIET